MSKLTDKEKAERCLYSISLFCDADIMQSPRWPLAAGVIMRLIRRERAEARRETEARIKAMLGQDPRKKDQL